MDRVDESQKLAEEGGQQLTIEQFHTAYFYYFDYRGAGSPNIAAYELFSGFDEALPEDAIAVATGLAVNAALKGKNPPKYANNVGDLVRRRKGYVIFAVEGAVFDHPAVEIKRRNYRHKGHANDKFDGSSNGSYTFTPLGTPFDVKVTSTRSLSVAVYSCSMKKKNYQELDKGEWEDFDIGFSFARRARPPLEDGGTNMGPPPPPPGR